MVTSQKSQSRDNASSKSKVHLAGMRLFKLSSYAAASFLVLFIIMASSKTLSDMLGISFLEALHNEEAGVYADCSKRENRKKPYCQPKVSHQQRGWNDLTRAKGRNHPFTLHDG